jgi:hypothetical protein
VFGVKDGLIVEFAEHKDATPDGRELDSWRRVDFVFHISGALQ